MINSPFRWVGGKSRLRKQIISVLCEHTCYVEPFAGAAWVLFGKPPSPVEVLNDIDQELINFFRVVRDDPEGLVHSFDWALVSRAEYEHLAEADPAQMSHLQRAYRFYYLIMAGWGGELNYPRFQTAISDGGHGNRLIGAIKSLRERIEPVHSRLSTVIIECLDWRECIDRYDRPGTVMYIDPPYPHNKCNYAHNMRSWDEHVALAARLDKVVCRWVYSSYDTDEIRSLFHGHYVMPVESASGMSLKKNGSTRVMNREVLITNFIPSGHRPKKLPSPQAELIFS